jgi:hypothetical protein
MRRWTEGIRNPGVFNGVSIDVNYPRVLPTLTGLFSMPACEPPTERVARHSVRDGTAARHQKLIR